MICNDFFMFLLCLGQNCIETVHGQFLMASRLGYFLDSFGVVLEKWDLQSIPGKSNPLESTRFTKARIISCCITADVYHENCCLVTGILQSELCYLHVQYCLKEGTNRQITTKIKMPSIKLFSTFGYWSTWERITRAF